MVRRRRMSAKQLKYFGKRRKRVYAVSVPRKRRKVSMARYRKRSYSRGSRGIGGAKGMIAPILGGVADNVIDSYSPIDGIGGTIVGMFMKNEMTKNIGLYKVGFSLGNFLPIPRGNSGTSGGFQ